jgi:hypothetical protein
VKIDIVVLERLAPQVARDVKSLQPHAEAFEQG